MCRCQSDNKEGKGSEVRRSVPGMLEAAASGYLLKECAIEELARAILQLAGGMTFLSPKISEVVVKGYLHKAPGQFQTPRSMLLPLELYILQLPAERMATKEIAEYLKMSINTVETTAEDY
jgi:two-component system response regulator NreC